MRVINVRQIKPIDLSQGVGWVLLAPFRATGEFYNFGVRVTYQIRRAVWAIYGLAIMLGIVFILYDFGWQIFHRHSIPSAQQHQVSLR